MKKYKRMPPFVSPTKITIFAVCFVIISILFAITVGADLEYCKIICLIAFLLAFVCDLIIIIGAAGRYRFSDRCVELFYGPWIYKKLNYSQFNTVVISNASYNNGYGYGANTDIPIKRRIKQDGKNAKTVLPYITFHKSGYPVHMIKKGMSSRDLFMLNDTKIYCLGICWFDAFREMLRYIDCDIYILEDVYFRFKEQFDVAVSECVQAADRLHII